MSKHVLSVTPAEFALLSASKLHNDLRTGAKPNKYRNKRIEFKGIKFDSKKEAKRFEELKFLELASKISDLKLQQKISILPDWIAPDGSKMRGYGYVADFTYIENGVFVIEDVKSSSTANIRAYINKRKEILAKIKRENLNWKFIEIISKRGK